MSLAYALTTVARVKSFLGISSTSYDSLLEILIDVSTDYIENYCDRRFLQTTYTSQEYDGNGTNKILLEQYPVDTTATFTLQKRGSSINENNWSTVDSSLYHVKDGEGIVDYITRIFENIPRHYRVTYTAGYDFDNTTTFLATAGAADLEYACWKIVGRYFTQRKSSTGIKSESIGDYSVSYDLDIVNEDVVVERILNKYLRPNPM